MQSNSDSSLRSPVSGPSSSVSSLQSDVVLSVRGVSKKFCRNLKRSMIYGMQDLARNMFGGTRQTTDHRPQTADASFQSPVSQAVGLRRDEFWAVQDINFELKRGECLGLIGKNGSGKTTLLRLISGIFPPDAGEIIVRGRVGALIALGAGFHPHLTGRENIYLNGAILGLKRAEIDAQLQEIISFAEIGEFIDAPVSTYSSGMTVRLGFAIATAIKPDLLLIDEVLAVGDAAFRARCYNRIGNVLKTAAVVFVSHSMQQVSQICSSTMYMQKGRVKWLGDVAGGIAGYGTENLAVEGDKECTLVVAPPLRTASLTFSTHSVKWNDCLTARLELELDAPMPRSSIRIPFYNPEGLVVAEWNSKRAGICIDLVAGRNAVEIVLGPMHLGPAKYDLALVLNDETGILLPFWSLKQHSVVVQGGNVGSCEYQMPHSAFSCQTLSP